MSQTYETYKDKPLTPAHSSRFGLPSLFRLPPAPHQRKARRSRLKTVLTLLLVLCLFISPLYFVYKPPSFLINLFQHHWPDVLFSVDTKEKLVALTIDDAPSKYTEEIRQLLKENEAKATFFVIGSQVSGREKILQDLVLDGHELGNHAMRDEPSRDLATSTLIEEINNVDKLIATAYEAENLQRPQQKFFRPGSGFFSSSMRKTVTELGYKMVLGSIYPNDAQIDLPSLNSWHILSMLKPGAIVICHDRREWTLPMLRHVLPEMKRRGWQFVSVGELLRKNDPAEKQKADAKTSDGSTKVEGTDDGKGKPLVEDLLKEGDEGGAALEEEREG